MKILPLKSEPYFNSYNLTFNRIYVEYSRNYISYFIYIIMLRCKNTHVIVVSAKILVCFFSKSTHNLSKQGQKYQPLLVQKGYFCPILNVMDGYFYSKKNIWSWVHLGYNHMDIFALQSYIIYHTKAKLLSPQTFLLYPYYLKI